MQQDLSHMDITSLRNLFFNETRAFLSALDTELSEELEVRREYIRYIDHLIESKKKFHRSDPQLK